jgi:hypothetical protein
MCLWLVQIAAVADLEFLSVGRSTNSRTVGDILFYCMILFDNRLG